MIVLGEEETRIPCSGGDEEERSGRPWTPLASDCKWCRTVNGVAKTEDENSKNEKSYSQKRLNLKMIEKFS